MAGTTEGAANGAEASDGSNVVLSREAKAALTGYLASVSEGTAIRVLVDDEGEVSLALDDSTANDFSLTVDELLFVVDKRDRAVLHGLCVDFEQTGFRLTVSDEALDELAKREPRSWFEQKFIENGTGQVFYLYTDEQGGWLIGMFVGGPSGVQPIARFETRECAEAWLAARDAH